jgi:hypothetical protein
MIGSLIFFLLTSDKRAIAERTDETTLRTEIVSNEVIIRGRAKQYILFYPIWRTVSLILSF